MADIRTRKWIDRMTDMANTIASWSKDVTQVGCVVVNDDCEILASGYNGFPRGVRDDIPERAQRPLKYQYVAHAEVNAVFFASRHHVSLRGSTLVLSNLYGHVTMPCSNCAIAIIQAGIRRVICETPRDDSSWAKSFEVTLSMLKEAGIEVILRDTLTEE